MLHIYNPRAQEETTSSKISLLSAGPTIKFSTDWAGPLLPKSIQKSNLSSKEKVGWFAILLEMLDLSE